ncbi:hypothetical protein MWU54_03175 [Marivita sp. S6314]|uniref:hypothetical protein n=1 Tax=Marivita sp. S6314 TaxID=2926406 RepID=UPI001FF30AC4|nr:hypothetical protein [Marivita sp. S6314]MCK0149013.1 hypothetical protein [Marivita sp. S6314]
MTENINRLAWFAAALTIIAWAFVPRLVEARPIYFPKIPVIDTTLLPPAGPVDTATPDASSG